jgi:hypothetical protein
MKFNGFSYPHPVLGLNDDVEGIASVEVEIDESADINNYTLNIKYTLENPDLDGLIQADKCEFLCELNCTSTLFRRAEKTSGFVQTIKVSKDFVRETVELQFVLVTKQPFNYKNSKAHPELQEYIFDLDEGDVLAYLGDTDFFAGIAYKKLTAVSSFMEIKEGKNEKGFFNIILDEPKIVLELSKDDYVLYSNRKIANSKNAEIFHASLVFPALVYALNQLITNQEEYNEQAWAKIILHRMSNDSQLNTLTFEIEQVPKISQILLALPAERLLNHINHSLNIEEEND